MKKLVRGITNISALTKVFVEQCRSKGRLSIDQALEIAEAVGLFDSVDVEIITKGKKQLIREIFSRITNDGERVVKNECLSHC